MVRLASVHWAPEAFDDLDRLHHFLHEKSPGAAQRAVTTIQAAVDRLRLFPASGRPVEGLPPSYRELLVNFGTGGYVVHYFANDRGIEILSVRHFREASPPRP